jgi:hypothetical protein
MEKDIDAMWELNRDALMTAAVMRRAGLPEVVLSQAEIENADIPDVSRSFSLSGDTITIRLSDADAVRLDVEAGPSMSKDWSQLSSGERVGVTIACVIGAAMAAAVFLLIVKGLIALVGWAL